MANTRLQRRDSAGKLLVLLLLALPVATVQAQFDYTITNYTVTITGYTGPGGDVVIPPTIEGLPVTSIGDWAFGYCRTLTSITMPNSVVTIGDSAFWQCLNLRSAPIPNGLSSIGMNAFNGTDLASVIIPYSVTNIGFQAFLNCNCDGFTVDPLNSIYSSLDGVLFNKNRTLLIQCSMARAGNYTVPDGVTSVGTAAFEHCWKLTSATIPESVTDIGERAFRWSGLTNITIGARVINIGSHAFEGTALQSVTIPDSVTSLGESAFIVSVRLTNVVIGNSVTNIGNLAFYGCPSLTTVTIPNSVSCIGDAAFKACTNLSELKIGSGVATIGQEAFEGSGLTSVTIPDNVKTIGDWAFSWCPSLVKVSIGNGVTNIGYAAFGACASLAQVTVGSGITGIGRGAFEYCTNLTAVCFLGNAPSADSSVFDATENAIVYYLPGTTGWGTTFGGRPTAPWVLPYPMVLKGGSGFGARASGFGFTISWATNVPVLVEACTDLSNPSWFPVSTNTLTDGSFYFSDPQWTKYPARFYRLRSQ